MRSSQLFIGVVASALIGVATAPAAAAIQAPSTNIPWLPAATAADIDTAFAQARTQNKPLLLYWGATWCPPCNQLKATFFNRQDFAQAASGFIAVHVDGDRPGAQKLGSRFKVGGYPTVVLFTPDGSRIVSASEDDTIRIWDAATYELQRTLPAERVMCLAISPDGKTLIGGGKDSIRLWNLAVEGR